MEEAATENANQEEETVDEIDICGNASDVAIETNDNDLKETVRGVKNHTTSEDGVEIDASDKNLDEAEDEIQNVLTVSVPLKSNCSLESFESGTIPCDVKLLTPVICLMRCDTPGFELSKNDLDSILNNSDLDSDLEEIDLEVDTSKDDNICIPKRSATRTAKASRQKSAPSNHKNVSKRSDTGLGLPCQYCSRTFKKKFALTKHINYKHVTEKNGFFIPSHLAHSNEKGTGNDLPSDDISLVNHEILAFKNAAARNDYAGIVKEEAIEDNDNTPSMNPIIHSSIIAWQAKFKNLGQVAQKCPECGNTFHLYSSLRRHLRRKHGFKLDEIEPETYSCPQCSKVFGRKSGFMRHLHNHEKQGLEDRAPLRFVCGQCDMAFNTKRTLVSHIRTHTGEKPYSCDVCGMRFSQQGTLGVHKRRHRGELPFPCPLCNQAFRVRSSLNSHLVTHNKVFSFQCTKCEKAFCRKNDLRKHMIMHSGEKSFKCRRCKKIFHDIGIFRAHCASHKNEKFPCTICEKEFSEAAHLRRHMKMHRNELNYNCGECDKRFLTKDRLVIHMRVHSGEKPYLCNVCGNRFAQKAVLNRHNKCVHGIEPGGTRICLTAQSKHHDEKMNELLDLKSSTLEPLPLNSTELIEDITGSSLPTVVKQEVSEDALDNVKEVLIPSTALNCSDRVSSLVDMALGYVKAEVDDGTE